MKRKGIPLSFKVRISLVFALVTCVIVSTMAVILFTYFKNTTLTSFRSAIDLAVTANANELQALMNRIQMSVDLINANETVYFKEDITQPEFASLVCNYEHLEDESDLYPMIVSLKSVNKQNNNLFLYCFGSSGFEYSNKVYINSGYPIAEWLNKRMEIVSDSNGIFNSANIEEEDWYVHTAELAGENYWFALPDNPGRLYMAKQLKYQTVDAMVHKVDNFAVLTLWFEIDWIAERIRTSEVTQNASVWIMNNQNQIIYTSNDEVSKEFTCVDVLVEDKTIDYEITGKDYLLQKTLLNSELYMITAVPMEDIQNMSFDIIKVIGMVAAVMISVGLVLVVIMSSYLVKPIQTLADHMRSGKIEGIDYCYIEDDEVSTLYRSFNYLIEHIKKLMQDVVEASERKKRAEFHALQAQINPHFIYNTLNSISSVELLSGRKEIASVLYSLSQMIRYNIKDPDGMVPLKDDIKIIRCYASIQQFSYRNEVQFGYEIAPETENIPIPKVVIQPLVENAFIHGTKIIEHDAKIRLFAYVKENKLCIQVWDNGTDADVAWINRYIRGKEDLERYTDSLGIRNVYERIHMVYGEEGDLVYSQDEEGCTVATISLPF